jgi:hypothetical protein
MASETRMNTGALVDSYVFAYGTFLMLVHQHSFAPRFPLIVHMTFVSRFNYVLGYLN